jgi:hypothetical protein
MIDPEKLIPARTAAVCLPTTLGEPHFYLYPAAFWIALWSDPGLIPVYVPSHSYPVSRRVLTRRASRVHTWSEPHFLYPVLPLSVHLAAEYHSLLSFYPTFSSYLSSSRPGPCVKHSMTRVYVVYSLRRNWAGAVHSKLFRDGH